MKNKSIFLALALTLSGVSGYVAAGELDPVIEKTLPRQLVVRVDNSSGESKVFKAFSDLKVDNDSVALALANAPETLNNAVATQSLDELDQDTSTAAWYRYNRRHHYRGHHYNYAYYYYGYNYYYSPYYHCNYSNYSYYYYRY